MNKGTAVANVYFAESAYLSERVMGSNHNQNMMLINSEMYVLLGSSFLMTMQ